MKTSCAFLTLLLLGPGIMSAAAQTTTDQARFDEIAKSAAQQFANARESGEQTRPTIPITTPGPNVELTLDDATARALEKNLDIAVERLNPEIQDLNMARIRAVYRPTFTSALGHRAVTNPPASQLNGGTITQTRIDQSVLTASTNASQFTAFNPFASTPVEGTNWALGPNFGTALNRFAYTTPRQVRVGFGIRF
jgi:outer membrane protein TolC